MTNYLRKAGVRQRYGGVSNSTVERMRKDGRLPPPKFFGDGPTPFWDESELDEHDRLATLRPDKSAKNRRRDEALKGASA